MENSHAERGRIQLILGPMFSGKTTELIRRCKRFQFANYSCAVVKYARDVRYSEEAVATHEGRTLTAAFSALTLQDLLPKLLSYDVVGIDEGQFFPDIEQVAESLANAGKVVVVAALDGTFQRRGFAPILALVPLAEEVAKLTAVCMLCFKDAAFTKRTSSQTDIEVSGRLLSTALGPLISRGFAPILALVPLAEEVAKLTAVCMLCFKDAAFTKRTSSQTDIEVSGRLLSTALGPLISRGFAPILALVPLAEEVAKLTAVCMLCFKDAAFTKRTSSQTDIEVSGRLLSTALGPLISRGFAPILALVPLAEEVAKLTAVCRLCFKDAAFTKRTSSQTDIEVSGRLLSTALGPLISEIIFPSILLVPCKE